MSGASTWSATWSNVSIMLTSSSATIIAMPPACRPSRSGIGSPPTPGRRSSGRSSPASAAACASRRVSSSRRTTAVSAAASFGSDIDRIPPNRRSATSDGRAARSRCGLTYPTATCRCQAGRRAPRGNVGGIRMLRTPSRLVVLAVRRLRWARRCWPDPAPRPCPAPQQGVEQGLDRRRRARRRPRRAARAGPEPAGQAHHRQPHQALAGLTSTRTARSTGARSR